MNRDVLFSALIHIGIIAATVISSPLAPRSPFDFDDVIRVSITSPSEIMPAAPVPLEPIPVPSAATEPDPEISIDDPTTSPEAVIPEKPKPKPKPKKKQTKSTPGPSKDQAEATDQVEAPTGTGSPFVGATIDNASFDYPYWFTQAFNKIAGNFRNPIAYDGKLVCIIYFQVIKSGRVVEVRIEQTSGIKAFDDAVWLAIDRSAPFPPLPSEFRDEILGITLPVSNR